MQQKEILSNIQNYTAMDLAKFIRVGIITIDDLMETSQFRPELRKEIARIMNNGLDLTDTKSETPASQKEQNIAFEEVPDLGESKKSESPFPFSIFQEEKAAPVEPTSQPIENPTATTRPANNATQSNIWNEMYGKKPEQQIIEAAHKKGNTSDTVTKLIMDFYRNGKISKDVIITLIRNDNNIFTMDVIKDLCLTYNVLTPDDLHSAGITDDFITAMVRNVHGFDVEDITNPFEISRQCSEVYFWGIPASGKSCVIGALLSVLRQGNLGLWRPLPCTGKTYMEDLAEQYKENQVVGLIAGTSVNSTYEMAFNISRDPKTQYPVPQIVSQENNTQIHPFTFIDLAGGLLELMGKYDKLENMTDQQIESLDKVTNLIIGQRKRNRKMHCFVIEYNEAQSNLGENEIAMHKQKEQDRLLMQAFNYIKNTDIFNGETDIIYVIVTKADRTHLHGPEVNNKIEKFVKEGHYANFYAILQNICKTNGINGGVVPIVPFSIGDVKMQSLCKFNPTPAERFMERIIQRSFSFDESKKGKIIGGLRNE